MKQKYYLMNIDSSLILEENYLKNVYSSQKIKTEEDYAFFDVTSCKVPIDRGGGIVSLKGLYLKEPEIIKDENYVIIKNIIYPVVAYETNEKYYDILTNIEITKEKTSETIEGLPMPNKTNNQLDSSVVLNYLNYLKSNHLLEAYVLKIRSMVEKELNNQDVLNEEMLDEKEMKTVKKIKSIQKKCNSKRVKRLKLEI